MPLSEVTAIGVSVTANLAGKRQIVLQCHFPADAPVGEGHELIDRLMALADRQEAKAELPGLKEELDKHESALANLRDDLKRVEDDFAAKLTEKTEAREKLVNQQESVKTEAYETHYRSGRQGDPVLTGSAKGTYNNYGTAIAQIDEQINKDKAEREAALVGVRKNEAHFEKEIKKLKAEKSRLENLAR